jgi:hypothetical protein
MNNEKNIRFAFKQSKSLENLAFFHPLSNEIDNILHKNNFRRDKIDPTYQFSKKQLESTFFDKFFQPQNYFYSNSPFSLKLKEKMYEINDKHISSENFKNVLKQIMNIKQTNKLNIKCLKPNNDLMKLLNPISFHKSPFMTDQEPVQGLDKCKLDVVNTNNIKQIEKGFLQKKSNKNNPLISFPQGQTKIKATLKNSASLPQKLTLKKSYKDVIQLNEEKKTICFKPSLIKKIEPSQIIFDEFEKKFPTKLSKVNSFHRMVHHHKAYLDHTNQNPPLPIIKTLI